MCVRATCRRRPAAQQTREYVPRRWGSDWHKQRWHTNRPDRGPSAAPRHRRRRQRQKEKQKEEEEEEGEGETAAAAVGRTARLYAGGPAAWAPAAVAVSGAAAAVAARPADGVDEDQPRAAGVPVGRVLRAVQARAAAVRQLVCTMACTPGSDVPCLAQAMEVEMARRWRVLHARE